MLLEVRREALHHDRPDDGSRERAHAAEHHDDHDGDRELERSDVRGLERSVLRAENTPAKPAVDAPIAKAITLYLSALMPSESAAGSSSRMRGPRRARPWSGRGG